MSQRNNIKSYSSITQSIIKYNNTNEKLETSESYLKNGYSLIKKNPITKKVEILYSSNYESKKKN